MWSFCNFFFFFFTLYRLVQSNLKIAHFFNDCRFCWRQQVVTRMFLKMPTSISFIFGTLLYFNQKFVCDTNVHLENHILGYWPRLQIKAPAQFVISFHEKSGWVKYPFIEILLLYHLFWWRLWRPCKRSLVIKTYCLA